MTFLKKGRESYSSDGHFTTEVISLLLVSQTAHNVISTKNEVGIVRTALNSSCPKDSALTFIKLILNCEEFDYFGICIFDTVIILYFHIFIFEFTLWCY